MSPIASLPCPEPPDPCPPSGVQLSAALSATLTAFVRENFERATFWMMRLRVPEPDAEELVQDALIALYERLCRCDDMSSEAWLAWLHTTLRHKNDDRRRVYARRKRREPLASHRVALRIAPATACPERVVEHRELVAKVQRFTGELAPERREVVERYLFQNEPMAKIAETLGVSVNTIKTRWRLAKEDIEAAFARERAADRFYPDAEICAFLLLLWTRARSLLQSFGSGAGQRRASKAAAPCEGRSGGGAPAGLIGLAAVAVLVASHTAIRPLHLSESEAEVASAESTLGLVGQRVPAWAEREREAGRGVVVVASAGARARTRGMAPAKEAASPKPAARPITSGPPPVHAMLSKAREALRRGDFGDAATALRDYETTHRDPNQDDLHRSLRIELTMRILDAARPLP
jgi:RNA polymerase sigma factor (sigma-70 family)